MLNAISFTILLILFPATAFATNSDPLEKCLIQVENQARQVKSCQVLQVLPDECDKYLQPSILSTLQCSQQGATIEQINQAITRGELTVKGNPSESPYEIIKSKLLKTPFFISPEKINFVAYSKQCADNKEKLFRAIALSIKDGQAKFIFTPLPPTSCLTLTNLEKKYPVLSAAQLEKFKAGYYLELQPSTLQTFENIEIRIVDTYQQAGNFFSEMTHQSRLTINTIPADAKIKILTIKRPYKKAMKLNVGQYKVQVSSPTYVTKLLTVDLKDKDTTLDITLKSSIESIQCVANQENYPVEFTNKYHLTRMDNCTYQLKPDPASKMPFKLLLTRNNHPGKKLLKARLQIVEYDQAGNISAQGEVLLDIRAAAIQAGTIGVSDVPALSLQGFKDGFNASVRIIDATFSD